MSGPFYMIFIHGGALKQAEARETCHACGEDVTGCGHFKECCQLNGDVDRTPRALS